jgi:hypothetical protein
MIFEPVFFVEPQTHVSTQLQQKVLELQSFHHGHNRMVLTTLLIFYSLEPPGICVTWFNPLGLPEPVSIPMQQTTMQCNATIIKLQYQ